MKKLRKMLGKADSPYIVDLMNLIETQSKATLCQWCIDYAQEYLLPIFLKYYPQDNRPMLAIDSARAFLKGEVKLPQVKDIILNSCHQAAREAEQCPAGQAAARAIGQASASVHAPTHSLGIAFYGAAAIAYDRLGADASEQQYECVAQEVCEHILRTLQSVAVDNEPNKARINWRC